MILAVSQDQMPYTLGVRNDRKAEILAAMTSFEPTALSEGYAHDYATGEVIAEKPDEGYDYGGLLWTGEQIYNFDKHNLVLNPDFCDAILVLREERGA